MLARQPEARAGVMTPSSSGASADRDLCDLLETLDPKARDDLRRVLIRDQADPPAAAPPDASSGSRRCRPNIRREEIAWRFGCSGRSTPSESSLAEGGRRGEPAVDRDGPVPGPPETKLPSPPKGLRASGPIRCVPRGEGTLAHQIAPASRIVTPRREDDQGRLSTCDDASGSAVLPMTFRSCWSARL